MTDQVDAWMRARVAGYAGPVEIAQFPGGLSNPTYRLTTPAKSYVLRRKPFGELLPSAHAVEREFRVQQALFGSTVPVSRMYALCEDPSVIGSAFYVMDFADGRVFWDPTLPDLAPSERGAIYDAMNGAIAALHGVDPRSVGLGDYGPPSNYLARQISRWTKQYRASETSTIEAMDRLIDWLPAHLPETTATTIVHGDYRLDNLIFHATEPRVIAVIDWELSTLGDPLADLACHMMPWRIPPDVYRGLAGVDLAALGIPDEAQYLERYRERTGRAAVADWDYYLAYGLFRFAAILQGVYKRGLQGNASTERALTVGSRVAHFADLAASLVW
jgi:aminoglycoside phosphotransferase (APT) family kinase protein